MTTNQTPRSRGLGTAKRLGVALAALLGACGPTIEVSTTAAPEAASLAHRRTFTIVENVATIPVAGDGDGNGRVRDNPSTTAGYGVQDPMIDNSITSRAVATLIRAELEARGFRYVTADPDFEVRFDAAIAPIQDIRSYDYGYDAGFYGYGYPSAYYGYGYAWDGGCCDSWISHAVATYERKTVIIDVVDPASQTLLWRGQGTSDGYNEPRKFMKDLKLAVREIVKEFPAPRARLLAAAAVR